MQDTMFVLPIPPLLALGFLIGFILTVIGYRDISNIIRHNHLMGLGIAVIGIMIPVTPTSWYVYWIFTSGLVLGILDIAIIVISLIIGIVVLYLGLKTYSKSQ